jgi:pimeloyl-ACP methyl ester carboxylesterase
MGNQSSVSSAVESLAHSSIYKPPPANYARRNCLFTRTTDGDSIAMRLYSPDVRVVNRFCFGDLASSTNDLLIVSHGNASDIGEMHRFCEHLSSALHIDVLVYDYPGYGHSSPTKTSQKNILESIDAVFETCLKHGWPQTRIFLLGHSLGSVPTVYLAAKKGCRVSGVVLLAPLASGPRVVLQGSAYVSQWVMGKLDWVLFDNVDAIGDIVCPIAMVHGTGDTTVSVEHTELLKKHVSESGNWPTLFLEVGHNALVDVHSKELLKVTEYIAKFRQQCLLIVSERI